MECELLFPDSLLPAHFRRRLNRFLVEVDTDGGIVQSHLHDPGRLSELLVPGAGCWLRPAISPGRRTRYTLALVERDGVLVSVDTSLPNRLLEAALRAAQGRSGRASPWRADQRQTSPRASSSLSWAQ